MFLDIHALHTLPYSNVNRDGLGSPKSCIYGGVQRIRVSSQSWKRAARLQVESQIGSPTLRTRQIAATVAKQLVEQENWGTDDARRAGRAIVQAYGLTPEDADDITKVLLWLPYTVLDELATLAIEHRDLIRTLSLPELDEKGKSKRLSKDEKDKRDEAARAAVALLKEPVTRILNERNATIALLGRMLADTPDHTVDGATEVAHAFTVHEAAPDFDYFTAVDDLAPNSGAGHLATAEFATGTFYRYSTINVTQFDEQLADHETARQVIAAWVRTFLTVVPSGKKNSTAANTAPDLVYIAVRNSPLSLAAGFEKPISTSGFGYLDRAVDVLNDYTTRLHRFLGDDGLWSGYAGTIDTKLPALGDPHESLDKLVQHSCDAVFGTLPVEASS
ncbi:type I-E CRISPR-associated protein Cas7/Cse4/CasC [Nocardia sp. NPDC088792]|uniref:type I-E CRISPR-associated protein Cas7/Cse4/CasC n=1 Tax=Nocardia sp. NPDC088792 TaxID=3364332 RepID=UPI0037FFF65D